MSDERQWGHGTGLVMLYRSEERDLISGERLMVCIVLFLWWKMVQRMSLHNRGSFLELSLTTSLRGVETESPNEVLGKVRNSSLWRLWARQRAQYHGRRMGNIGLFRNNEISFEPRMDERKIDEGANAKWNVWQKLAISWRLDTALNLVSKLISELVSWLVSWLVSLRNYLT